MSTKYTPIFTKDGNDHIIPSGELVRDNPDEARAMGQLYTAASAYGLVPSGNVATIDEENGYEGPYIIAAVGGLTTWIVGGASLDELTKAGHDAVQNLPPAEPEPEPDDPMKTATTSGLAFVEGNTVLNGDHTGPDGQ